MGYCEALEAAGAKVINYQDFGDYQGSWYAAVEYEDKTFWVVGYYGSCSGCDSFQAEFDYGEDDEGCDMHKYSPEKDCEMCILREKEYNERLALFGRSYLDDPLTQQQVEEMAAKNLDWDMEAEELLDWLQCNSIEDER